MKYVSTRNKNVFLSASETIAQGLADDGGLLTVTKGGTALTKEELLARGMNQSRLHEDVMLGAEDSHITGKCRDGRTVELFRDGVWVL